MQFNSFEFFLFIAVFLAGWPFLRRSNNVRWAYLALASFVFYGWWDYRFLGLLIVTAGIDFFAGLGIERWPRYRKLLLVASLSANIGSLACFKYLDFMIQNINSVLAMAGAGERIPLANLILPAGISFYTFHSMSYTIDVYRRLMKPTHNILHFYAFVSMFPQLVAGPIVRGREMLPQLETYNPPTEQARWDGLRLIVHGFFKKVVLADNLAHTVNTAFNQISPAPSGVYWWVVAMMFATQIYCDFSGYSDIGRGLAKWIGYELPLNFNHPYISTSFREFWTRWHISLSTWFRDYLYIPIGGSRQGGFRSHLNMWITMLVSGLWHGAAWTFLGWASLHAFFITLERVTNWPKRLCAKPGGRIASAIIVLAMVLVSWVFFRSKSFEQAWGIVKFMFGPGSMNLAFARQNLSSLSLQLLALAMLREAYFFAGLDRSRLMQSRTVRRLEPVAIGLLIGICVYFRGPGSTFIYFQF